MTKMCSRRSAWLIAGGLATLLAGPPALAQQPTNTELEERIQQLERRLGTVSKESGSADRATAKWHLAGYFDAGFAASNEEDATEEFTAGRFNPGFHFQYGDILLIEAELELATEEDGTTDTALEYAQADLLVHDSVTVIIGKFLSPIGQFQERLHPSWINKLPDAPAGFGHGGVQPLSDVGLQVRGGIPVGGDSIVGYALYAGNGPRTGHHGVELEGFGGDDNDDKAVGGRLSFLTGPNVEIGASFLTAAVTPEDGGGALAISNADYDLFGADVSVTPTKWDLRAEYLDSELSRHVGQPGHGDPNAVIPETEFEAWYAQAARRIGKWEPVIRVGEFTGDGFGEFLEEAREERSIGLNYWLSPSAVFKLSVQQREFEDPAREEHERVLFQVAYGF